jgi:hypothetical protein
MQLWKVATYRWEKTVHEEKSKPSLVVMFYINDVISLNNSKFDDYLDCIYPTEVEINDTIEIAKPLLHARN